MVIVCYFLKGMGEEAASEGVAIGAAGEQFLDRIGNALGGDPRILSDGQHVLEDPVGGGHDDPTVANPRDRPLAGFDVAREELVEGEPAARGDVIILHVESRII